MKVLPVHILRDQDSSVTQSHSHSPLSSFTSEDPEFVPAIMWLVLIYFGTCSQNVTTLHVYCCAVLTKKRFTTETSLFLCFCTYFVRPNNTKGSILNSSQRIVSNKVIKECVLWFSATHQAAELWLLQKTEQASGVFCRVHSDLFAPFALQVSGSLGLWSAAGEISQEGICLSTRR